MAETYPGLQIKRLPCVLPCGVSGRSEIRHIHKCDTCEHNGLEQQKADSARISRSLFHDAQELSKLNERHVRVHVLDVRAEEGVAERYIRDGECALLP